MKTYITLTDKNGTKKYQFSPNFRRNLKLFFASIIIIFSVLIYGIYALKMRLNEAQILTKSLQNETTLLNLKNETLIKNIADDKSAKLQAYINESNEEQINEAFKSSDLRENAEKIDISAMNQKSIKKKILSAIPNEYPVPNAGITDKYGYRIHPITHAKAMHEGIDLRADIGTKVRATADGVVEYAAASGTGYGYLVIISHNFGFSTRYAHLSNYDVVKVGQFVKKGDLIGYSGNTGRSTGPHLHYEVRFLQRTIDPANFIAWNGKDGFGDIFQNERKVPWQGLINAISEF